VPSRFSHLKESGRHCRRLSLQHSDEAWRNKSDFPYFYVAALEQIEGLAVYGRRKDKLMSLLKWALIFLVVSIVAALFGFGGISAASADIAKILFYIFVIIFIALLVLGILAARRV
jgi:uncharacterized membrane protein YtjA (UPF0391 family)